MLRDSLADQNVSISQTNLAFNKEKKKIRKHLKNTFTSDNLLIVTTIMPNSTY